MLVIWEENHDYGSVIGSKEAPELNAVASQCGLATAAHALTHPSLPNYLEQTSGVPYGRAPFDGDCSPGGACLASAPSIFGQEVAAGKQWRSYVEDMPRSCDPHDAGAYVTRHNPALYYAAVASQCALWDEPLGSPASGSLAVDARAGSMPALATLTPNLEHDMHDGTIAQADDWLRLWLPVVTQAPDYRSGRLAIIIAWDEGAGDGDAPSSVPMLVMSASTPAGARSAAPYDDFSILRTAEDITGMAPLGNAARAPSLRVAFRL